jgi:uncharacterized protein YbjT (DUF2867 family)
MLAVQVEGAGMAVLVTGGAGFVGNVTIRQLVARGERVRALVRNPEKAALRLGALGDAVEVFAGDVTQPDSLNAAMDGASAVVHTVAISMERGNSTYERVNYQGTVNVVEAAKSFGVSRFINISQNGADSQLPYAFMRSKGQAQDYVRTSGLDWTALRPSAIFGPQDEFFNTFARLVQLTPIVFPLIGGGHAEFQPVSIDDVASAIVKSLADDGTIGRELTLGGPEVLTLGQIEQRVVEAMGTRRTFVPVSVGLLRPVVAVMQSVLPGSPVSTSLLDLLAIPNTTPDNALVNTFGMQPIPFAGEHIAYLRENNIGDTLRRFFRNATIN